MAPERSRLAAGRIYRAVTSLAFVYATCFPPANPGFMSWALFPFRSQTNQMILSRGHDATLQNEARGGNMKRGPNLPPLFHENPCQLHPRVALRPHLFLFFILFFSSRFF